MSLINQMLKDLEARRSAGHPPPHMAASPEMPIHTVSPRRWPLYLLAVGLLLMILLSTFLLWERKGHTPDPSGQPDSVAQQQAPLAEARTPPPASPAKPVATAPASLSEPVPEPVPEPEPVPVPEEVKAPAAEPITRPTATRSPPLVAPAPEASPPVAAVSKDSTPAPVAAKQQQDTRPQQIERRIRPPSPEQVAEQHYQQGYQLLQQGEHAIGEQRWQEALLAHPPHIPAREGLVGLYLRQGRAVEARTLLREGIALQPGYGQFYLLQARLQLDDGQQQQALTTLEQGLARQPQGPDYLAFLAALYQREQAFEQSIAHYQRALSLQPEQTPWWMGLGISLEGAGKQTEARQAYQEALDRGGLSPQLQEFVKQRLR